jgi:hypothetical protein
MNTTEIKSICSKFTSKVCVYQSRGEIPSDCEVVIVETVTKQSLSACSGLLSRGFNIFKANPGYTYVKDGEVLNALKNPKKSEIRVEKPVQDAIIDVEKEPVAKPVGTTPDPTVLFPEKDEKEKSVEEKKEKPSYKSMKKKW